MGDPIKLPAYCEVRSHQFYGHGIAHAVGVNDKGPYVLVQYDEGEIQPVYVDGAYSVRLRHSVSDA